MKRNLHIKQIAPTVIEQITLFYRDSNNMKMKEKHMQDQGLHKNLLYKISVPTPMTKQNEMATIRMSTLTDVAVEVQQERIFITKIILHRIDMVLHLAISILKTEVPLLNIIHALDMIII